jgi:adenylate cyclase
VITDNDGFLMAFYGDCVVAVWPPGFSGPDHAEKALKAARELVAPGLIPGQESPVHLGVGLHRGPVFIGTVSAAKGLFRDVSIFGSEVILCARLAAAPHPARSSHPRPRRRRDRRLPATSRGSTPPSA